MKRERYPVEQIIAGIEQHTAGISVGDIRNPQLETAEGLLYRWKQQYGGLGSDEARKLTRLRERSFPGRGTSFQRGAHEIVTTRSAKLQH